jgi:hypothetical protein
VFEREGLGGGGHASFVEFRKNKCEKMSVFSSYFKAPSSRREKEGGGGVETRSKDRLSPKQLIGEQETDRDFFYET